MEQRWWDALLDVKDPEIPTVSIVEMGMVYQIKQTGQCLEVEVMPTFMGCPALEIIRKQVEERLLEEEGVKEVHVRFITDPSWTSDRITPTGREKLKAFGIAPPPLSHDERIFPIPACPYCQAEDGVIENLFGPTACRAIYYCKRCQQPFEGMKRI
ncbi:1,2-phenylacetyl-CoA epoxidase subunit PaaD [Thermoflavimicrobium dichotomicum]|uniref:Ring-1,2-phenylacetyl-CoA epoxidase subunit PaaD n=1 Tax=Thermoflavimicrobium dichotomicum TaxID=46223 RepID=A0A1I3LJJ7_9BACL|nr:1,2-phenylacetyl-CoA epoxidase subunit PaaD [Thermoflavimicrobium dichotomicum]SFI84934.1 ring-1,2-phenylacetyl-CoA epoxidase subunit PaaD [Thermoflavimicrobium dichotomicum]